MKPINREIFRAYDIRGLVDRDLDEDLVRELGRAMGAAFLRSGTSRALVARDCRPSSPGYARALARGMTESGVDVVHLGMTTTPVFYFTVKNLGIAAGAMVTASHNPSEFNGFKPWLGRNVMDEAGIAGLFELMRARDYEAGSGMISRLDPNPSYFNALCRGFRFPRPVKVVVDGGNGTGGPYAVEALTRAGAEVVPLHCRPDGVFPHHHPDPTIEGNMAELARAVREQGAELGIGLDGDADRIGVVDENGRLLPGDELLAIFAAHELARTPGAEIIADVKCSDRLYKDIAARGGRPVMSRTGHSIMKERMLSSTARLAGELSGHMFFRDWYDGLDDAVFAALKMVSIVAKSEQPVSAMTAHWPEAASTPKCASPARTRPNSRWSGGPRTFSARTGTQRKSTGFGPNPRTAGSWSGPPTPSPNWCSASRPATGTASRP